MDEPPPPYSPRGDASTPASPQIVLSSPRPAPSPPPPSYETATSQSQASRPPVETASSATPRTPRPGRHPSRLSIPGSQALGYIQSHWPPAGPSVSPASSRSSAAGLGRRASLRSAFGLQRPPSPSMSLDEAVAWAAEACRKSGARRAPDGRHDADARRASTSADAASTYSLGRSASVSPAVSPSTSTHSPAPGHNLANSLAATDAGRSTNAQQTLAAMFRMFPWRNAWGPVPENLDSALRTAALHAHEGLVRALLRNGAPITYADRYAATFQRPNGSALHAALSSSMPQLAEVITETFWQRAYEAELKKRIGPVNGLSAAERVRDPSDHVAADAAAAAVVVADREVLSLLDGRDSNGCTPLHMAASAGQTDQARALLRRGAELDAEDVYRRTPLYMAARYSHSETAAYLISQGAAAQQFLGPALSVGKGLDDLAVSVRIKQLIQKLLAEELKRPSKEGSIRAGQGTSSAGDSAEASSSSSLSAPYRGTSSLLYSGPSPGPATSRSNFAHGTAVPQTNKHREDPYDLSQLSTINRKAKRPLRAGRKPVPSAINTPEYRIWKAGLDRLEAEHRAQRERNKQTEDVSDLFQ